MIKKYYDGFNYLSNGTLPTCCNLVSDLENDHLFMQLPPSPNLRYMVSMVHAMSSVMGCLCITTTQTISLSLPSFLSWLAFVDHCCQIHCIASPHLVSPLLSNLPNTLVLSFVPSLTQQWPPLKPIPRSKVAPLWGYSNYVLQRRWRPLYNVVIVIFVPKSKRKWRIRNWQATILQIYHVEAAMAITTMLFLIFVFTIQLPFRF